MNGERKCHCNAVRMGELSGECAQTLVPSLCEPCNCQRHCFEKERLVQLVAAVWTRHQQVIFMAGLTYSKHSQQLSELVLRLENVQLAFPTDPILVALCRFSWLKMNRRCVIYSLVIWGVFPVVKGFQTSSETQTAAASPLVMQEFHQPRRDKKIKGSQSRRKSNKTGKPVYTNAEHTTPAIYS